MKTLLLKTQTRKSTLRNTARFSEWITGKGIDLANAKAAELHNRVNQLPLIVSSLKSRADYVKKHWNYDFQKAGVPETVNADQIYFDHALQSMALQQLNFIF